MHHQAFVAIEIIGLIALAAHWDMSIGSMARCSCRADMMRRRSGRRTLRGVLQESEDGDKRWKSTDSLDHGRNSDLDEAEILQTCVSLVASLLPRLVLPRDDRDRQTTKFIAMLLEVRLPFTRVVMNAIRNVP